jgi:hypothetical protein
MVAASRERIALIKDTLVAALSSLTCVRRIDSFGSVATGTADQWSDLDLLVTCHDVEQTAWLGAAVIRATREIAFYRMFTDVRQPSGRYWFRGESPFHRVDVSFLSTTARAEIAASGEREGYPVILQSEYVAQCAVDPAADAHRVVPAPRIETAADAGVGKLLYRYLEATKRERRGCGDRMSAAQAHSDLMKAMMTMRSESKDAFASFVTFVVESFRDLRA